MSDLEYSFREARKANKANDYNKAEEIYMVLYKKCPEKFHKLDKNAFAFLLYHNHIKCLDHNSVKSAEIVVDLICQKNTNKLRKPCYYTLSVLKMMNLFNSKEKYQDTIKWAGKLKVELLNSTPFRKEDGTLAPSQMEKWYLYLTKALLKLNIDHVCINLSKDALEKCPNLTYEIWFKWRLAKSYNAMEDYDNALIYLKELENSKKNWYVYREFSKSYYGKNDIDNALNYAVKSALTNEPPINKISVYKQIIKLLKEMGIEDEILKHEYLIYSIKSSLYDNIVLNDSLKTKFLENNFDLDNIDYRQTEMELRKYWASLKYKNQEQCTGTIFKMINDGFSGFIRKDIKGLYMGNEDETHYFNMNSVICDKDLIREGVHVSFYLEEGFDKKKGIKKMNAVAVEAC